MRYRTHPKTGDWISEIGMGSEDHGFNQNPVSMSISARGTGMVSKALFLFPPPSKAFLPF